MAKIGFIGLGNMGLPMALNLVESGHRVTVFDLAETQVEAAASKGALPASSAMNAAEQADVVITMLPEGRHVTGVLLGDRAQNGVLGTVGPDTLVVDCSTIDVETTRAVAVHAAGKGIEFCDAPVSGGVAGAEAGKLTFMVGGSEAAFERARPILEAMGQTIIHAGDAGNGQVAKVCNNMLLGIHMIAVSEAFALAESLGLPDDKLYEVCNQSSGQCWTMTNYCPVPGPVPTSPANRDYQGGFAAALMLKDLKLSQQAAQAAGAVTPLGAEATTLYGLFARDDSAELDCSAIVKMIKGVG